MGKSGSPVHVGVCMGYLSLVFSAWARPFRSCVPRSRFYLFVLHTVLHEPSTWNLHGIRAVLLLPGVTADGETEHEDFTKNVLYLAFILKLFGAFVLLDMLKFRKLRTGSLAVSIPLEVVFPTSTKLCYIHSILLCLSTCMIPSCSQNFLTLYLSLQVSPLVGTFCQPIPFLFKFKLIYHRNHTT